MKKQLAAVAVAGALALALTGCRSTDVYDSDEGIASEDEMIVTMNADKTVYAAGIACTFGSLSGKEALITVTLDEGATEGALAVDLDLTADSGRLKFVSIAPDGTVETLLEGTGTASATVAVAQEGEYRIAVIGEEAVGSYNIDITAADGVSYTIDGE